MSRWSVLGVLVGCAAGDGVGAVERPDVWDWAIEDECLHVVQSVEGDPLIRGRRFSDIRKQFMTNGPVDVQRAVGLSAATVILGPVHDRPEWTFTLGCDRPGSGQITGTVLATVQVPEYGIDVQGETWGAITFDEHGAVEVVATLAVPTSQTTGLPTPDRPTTGAATGTDTVRLEARVLARGTRQLRITVDQCTLAVSDAEWDYDPDVPCDVTI